MKEEHNARNVFLGTSIGLVAGVILTSILVTGSPVPHRRRKRRVRR